MRTGLWRNRVATAASLVVLLAVWWLTRTSLATAPSPGFEEGPRLATILGSPDPAGSSPATNYLELQADGTTPVTWSPCRPIHYVVRPDGMPPGGLALLQDGIAQVSALSGLRFVYDGPTDEDVSPTRRPYQRMRYGDRWAPVLVVWGDPSNEGGYTGGVPLAGWAGPVPVKAGDGRGVYVSGQVDLNSAWATQEMAQGESRYVTAVVLHELGHLVGLDHTRDEGLLMSPSNVGALQFSPDELRGLESLGAGACHRDV